MASPRAYDLENLKFLQNLKEVKKPLGEVENNLFSLTPEFRSITHPKVDYGRPASQGRGPGRSLTRNDETDRHYVLPRYELPDREETLQLPTSPQPIKSLGTSITVREDDNSDANLVQYNLKRLMTAEAARSPKSSFSNSARSPVRPQTQAQSRYLDRSQPRRLAIPKSTGAKLFNNDEGRAISSYGQRTHKAKFLSASSLSSSSSSSSAAAPPSIDRPHRVYPPPFMNTPERLDHLLSYNDETAEADAGPQSERESTRVLHATARQRIKDYMHRAAACRRAGRRRAEGNAYYCLGVIYDNMGSHLKAIDCYVQFQAALEACEDRFAAALAYNSIGVAYQYLGERYLPKAIFYHAKHRDIADVPGQFIAFTNLGLVYNQLGQHRLATVNHQHALRCSILMNSVAGQSIAIGNLGLTGFAQNDFVTAKACMQRHIELNRSQGLSSPASEAQALAKLGEIALQTGDSMGAQNIFSRTMRVAQNVHSSSSADEARMHLGVSLGSAQFENHMQKLVKKMASDAERVKQQEAEKEARRSRKKKKNVS